jgi:hypothetical protein
MFGEARRDTPKHMVQENGWVAQIQPMSHRTNLANIFHPLENLAI